MNRRFRPNSLIRLETLENRDVMNAVVSTVDSVSTPAPINEATSSVNYSSYETTIDEAGNITCVMPPLDPKAVSEPTNLAVVPPFALGDTFKLHSLPGATKVIYLDFDGHTTVGTQWNGPDNKNVITPKFSFEDPVDTFSNNELDRIQGIWQRVSEEFSVFNVDVTTEDPGVEALRKSGPGDVNWGMRVCIGGNGLEWYGRAVGGVAVIGSFAASTDTPCFVFPANLFYGEKSITDALCHEVGHTFGLNHDGNSKDGYDTGHQGPDAPGWAPIMGVGYYQPITQWSKGEYPDANNHEDDIAIIASDANGVGFRPDVVGDTIQDATPLKINGYIGTYQSLINSSTDTDVYRFYTVAGKIYFQFDPYARDLNVDINAELLDANGNVLLTNNKVGPTTASMSAKIDYNIQSPGIYYLRVKGSGAGDLATGYSNYGSIGKYSIRGFIATSSNQSPVLANNSNPRIDYIAADSIDPPSMRVGSFGSVGVTDADTGTVLGSIAVVGVDSQNGAWFYSIDDGVTWNDLTTASVSAARLLGENDLLKFVPRKGFLGTASLTYRAWDRSIGLNGDVFDMTTPGALTASSPFSAAVGTADVRVAPVIYTQKEDTRNLGRQLETWAGVTIQDADGKDAKRGFAIIGSGGSVAGRWEYLTGAVWKPLIGTTINDATLLRSTDSVRFVPQANAVGEAYLLYRAWDQTSGVAGARANTAEWSGGGGAFSAERDAFFFRVEGVNDRPVLDGKAGANLANVKPGDADPVGDLVSKIVGAGATDPDRGTVPGLAITSVAKTSGRWEYQLASGGGWKKFPVISLKTALLLGPDDRVRFIPDGKAKNASFVYKAWDRSKGQPGELANSLVGLEFSVAGAKASVNVTANPSIDNSAPRLSTYTATFTPIYEDSKPSGNTVESLLGNAFIDQDAKALKGIAVTGKTGEGKGVWQYSVNKSVWITLGDITTERALLLGANDKIRFLPNANFNGSATLSYRAWDRTRGTAGQYADVALPGNGGGSSPFDNKNAVATVNVAAVNDRPVLNTTPIPRFHQVAPGDTNSAGDLVSTLLGANLSDADANSSRGIALTNAVSKNGSWQYQLSGAAIWTNVPVLKKGQVFFLGESDRLRFVPTANFKGTESLTYRGWDGSFGIAGQTGLFISIDTSMSSRIETAYLTVIAGNAQPVLTLKTKLELPPVTTNDTSSAGIQISTLLGSSATDANSGTKLGIALVEIDNKNGLWEYSIDGTTWQPINQASILSANVLNDKNFVRFVPKTGFSGSTTFKFKVWDQSDSSVIGKPADTRTSNAFSKAIQTAILNVNFAPTVSLS